MSNFEKTSIWESESDPANTDYVSYSDFGTVGTLAIKEASETNRLTRATKSVYGYALLAASAGVIAFEQLPTNEDWRFKAGTRTLIETGSPVEVAKTTFSITMAIEIGSCAVIMAALHSSNPLIKSARTKFSEWRGGGLKRNEFRKEQKDHQKFTEAKEKDQKRVKKGKEPKIKEENVPKIISPNSKRLKEEITDASISLGIGAAITTLLRGVSGRDNNVFSNGVTAVKSSVFIGLFSGLLGYIIASGKEINFDIPIVNRNIDIGNILLDYGTDSKWIIGTLLLAYTPSTLKKLWHRMPKREARFQEWLASQHQEQDKLQTQQISA